MNHTKAGMLNYIKENMPSVNILPIMVLKRCTYLMNEKTAVEAVIQFAGNDTLAIRSSSSMEDTLEYSYAGAFNFEI